MTDGMAFGLNVPKGIRADGALRPSDLWRRLGTVACRYPWFCSVSNDLQCQPTVRMPGVLEPGAESLKPLCYQGKDPQMHPTQDRRECMRQS